MDIKNETQQSDGETAACAVKKGKLSERKLQLIFSAVLVFIAMLWGMGFVVQSAAMKTSIGPYTFNGVRNIVGGFSVLPAALIFGRRKGDEPLPSPQQKRAARKTLLTGGICCGVCLLFASSAQQIGLINTSPGKAGFITALYIVMVPLIGLFFGKKIGVKVWLGVAIAAAGLYLLCVTESFTVEKSDLIVLLCALFYSVHIVIIGYFSPKTDGIKMSCIQFFTAGIMSIPVMIITEHPTLDVILDSTASILYMGVFSCGVAFTLQIVAQKYVNPTVTSLLMSLESVFSVIFSWLILGDKLSQREGFGVLLMMIAIVLAQLPEKMNSRRKITAPEAKTVSASEQSI